jgi:catechol 2,3-dioxygenase-like lactoylglutathione lyase family enzyme
MFAMKRGDWRSLATSGAAPATRLGVVRCEWRIIAEKGAAPAPTTALILDLNHINIVTPKLDETRDFFVGVLGLDEGPRPNFPFDGYWLYAGDKAVVHLMSLDLAPEKRAAISPLDHAAFEVSDLNAAKRRLDEHGVRFREALVSPVRGQVFFEDPNGVQIELGGPVS